MLKWLLILSGGTSIAMVALSLFLGASKRLSYPGVWEKQREEKKDSDPPLFI